MPDCARLEITLSRNPGKNYTIRLICKMPKSNAEVREEPSDPIKVRFDRAALRKTGDPHEYGRLLAQFLFSSPVARQILWQARAVADRLEIPLRIRLTISENAYNLHNFHWETILDPERETPFCTDAKIRFSRYLSSTIPFSYDPIPRDRLSAAAFIANPTNLIPNTLSFRPFDMPAEILRVKTCLAETDLTLFGNDNRASLDNMICAMNDRDILYLVCHGAFIKGGNPYIWLEKADGTADVIDVLTIKEQLARARHLPMLAILVTCQSAGSDLETDSSALMALGPKLVEFGVPTVLAMHGDITIPTIAQFLPVFFRELWQDGQIDRAVMAARGAIQRTQVDWWAPVLFSRLTDNQLFSLPEGAGPLPLQDFEPETVFIPGGKFWMGRNPGPGIPDWETPCHEVDLPAYRIGKYPVTNAQFAEYIRDAGLRMEKKGWDGNKPLPDCSRCPVSGVTWNQAKVYCEWLQFKTGRKYILPSETQWEKAARGPHGWIYPWGNEWQLGRCNSRIDETTPVDLFPEQGTYGCFDMVGNLREWTISLWGKTSGRPDFRYPLQKDSTDIGAHRLMRRVVRGGAGTEIGMVCTTRSGYDPDDPGSDSKPFGFRVAMQIKE